MDVINGERKNDGHDKDEPRYVLTDDDVENILVTTDALYWTILQILRGSNKGAQDA